MKANKFIIAALAIAATASCQKDGLTGSEFTRETESATIISGADTKTSLNGKEIHWTSDDEIAVFDNTNYKNEFNITECEGSYAKFSGKVTTGTTQIYAVYPFELAVSASGSNLVVNIPTDQTSKEGSFAEEHNISVAKGVKTPGHEAIGDVTFQNVCALLKFTIPSYISDAHTVTLSSNSVIAGNMSVDCSGDVPACTISSEGSKSISMRGDYPAGSTFIFVLAPGTLDGFTVNVQTGMANWSISRTIQVALEAGKYKNLGTLELEQVSSASASASHTYTGNTLTGTDVTVNLNLPASTQHYITALNLVVKNKAGEEVRSVSKTSAAATETIGANEDWPYLPQGEYTVSGTYTLSGNTTKEISAISFTSPAPTFTGSASVSGVTSYSKYLNRSLGDPNAHNAETITNISASCPAIANISAKVLNKVPVSYTIAIDDAPHKTGTINTPSTTTVAADNKTGAAWGERTLKATFTFDGVEINCTSDCHITGLPYSFNFHNNSSGLSTSGWTTSGTQYDSSTDKFCIRYGGWLAGSKTSGYVVSPKFSFPEDVNTTCKVQAQAYSTSTGAYKPQLRVGRNNNCAVASTYTPHSMKSNLDTSSGGYTEYDTNLTMNSSYVYVSVHHDNGSLPSSAPYSYLCLFEFRLIYR